MNLQNIRNLPNGVYDAVWSGYVLRINIDNKLEEIQTDPGIRGKTRCVVIIQGNKISVEKANQK